MKYLAMYLPQFHPISENNEWWGKGFTEWRNVSQARPRFRGHNQPKVPEELGYYDLRLEETREAQAKMALEFGLDGFCYYHYWFDGKEVLETPFKKVLKNKNVKLPFCLCWANENWTRAWDGQDKQVLLAQKYSEKDHLAHLESMLEAFSDERYLKVNGKLLYLIYRPESIPNVKEMIQLWNGVLKEKGLPEIYFCGVQSNFSTKSPKWLIEQGFDSIMNFQPAKGVYPKKALFKRGVHHFVQRYNQWIETKKWPLPNVYSTMKFDYSEVVDRALEKPLDDAEYPVFPMVFPNFDNTPRRKEPVVIQNENPKDFGRWLKKESDRIHHRIDDEQIVFINAWNEWAEGAFLEPDLKNEKVFLQEVLKSKKTF